MYKQTYQNNEIDGITRNWVIWDLNIFPRSKMMNQSQRAIFPGLKRNEFSINWRTRNDCGHLLLSVTYIYIHSIKFTEKSMYCRSIVLVYRHEVPYTPGDHTFFLGKNCFGNTSCVSNMFFLKKNEKFLSWKNLIKMNHFIHIFLLWKMVYFTRKKNMWKMIYFPLIFLQEKFGKNVTFLCKKNVKKI